MDVVSWLRCYVWGDPVSVDIPQGIPCKWKAYQTLSLNWAIIAEVSFSDVTHAQWNITCLVKQLEYVGQWNTFCSRHVTMFTRQFSPKMWMMMRISALHLDTYQFVALFEVLHEDSDDDVDQHKLSHQDKHNKENGGHKRVETAVFDAVWLVITIVP